MTKPKEGAKVGRPPLDPSSRATWEAKVRIAESAGERLEALAKAEGVPVAVWIRDAIFQRFARERRRCKIAS